MKLKLLAIACFSLLLLFSFTLPGDRSFMQLPVQMWSVFAGDLDHDNDPDLITGHHVAIGKTNKSLSILMNNGAGYFSVTDTSKSYCGYQENIFAVDMDNDTWPDIVTFYSEKTNGIFHRFLRIWRNTNGVFAEVAQVDLNFSSILDWINHGDFNGDGLEDIVLMSNTDMSWGVVFNNGSFNFSTPVYYSLTYPPQHIECGELNSDGKDEIIISGVPTEIYSYSNGGFYSTVLETLYLEKTMVCDIDHDSDNDIVGYVYNMYQHASQIFSYINNNGQFSRFTSLQFDGSAFDQLMGEFNNDTLSDIAFLYWAPEPTPENPTGYAKSVVVYYNDGDYQFIEPDSLKVYYSGEAWRDFVSADFDNNGYNDFAITRYFSNNLPNSMELLYNDGNGTFQPFPVSVNDNTVYDPLVCYPTPFSESININFCATKAGNAEFLIYDGSGKIVRKAESETIAGLNEITLPDLNKLNKGVYFIKYSLDNRPVSAKKIIKI